MLKQSKNYQEHSTLLQPAHLYLLNKIFVPALSTRQTKSVNQPYQIRRQSDNVVNQTHNDKGTKLCTRVPDRGINEWDQDGSFWLKKCDIHNCCQSIRNTKQYSIV